MASRCAGTTKAFLYEPQKAQIAQMTRIHICDYGSGNILSVERALEKVGAEVVRCTSPDQLTDVRGLIIPGVGAFGDCMRGVRERGFEQPIHQLVDRGAWVLGICVGMQILATRSEEFGITEGLGIVPGTVKQLPEMAPDGSRLKRPHVGWSELRRPGQSWEGSPLERIDEGTAAYFVHSYHLVPDDPKHLLAAASYVGAPVNAAVRSGRVFGVQFHPEKSGRTGLAFLDGFLRLAQSA
jgi:glutamine amidotransferase